MRLNILIGNRAERIPRLMKELETQGITDYELWDGIFERSAKVKENINAAHRQIVEYADVAGWEEVCIAEDDVRFTHPNSWNFFLSNKPKEFDVYLSSTYTCEYNSDGTLYSFSGLHCYIVSRRFYKTFLSLPSIDHIDRAMSGLGVFIECSPYIAEQYNGFSSNTGKDEKYEHLMNGKIRYCG